MTTGALLACCYAGLWAGRAHEPGVPRFLGLMAAAFVLYGAACAVARRAAERAGLSLIIGGAVVFRLLMAGPVLFDDDLYRYHWDGRVLASGHNPYAYAPDDPRLAELRDEAWAKVSYRYVKTVYPPLTEALAAASYLAWPNPNRIRLLAGLFDLATIVPIVLLLRRLQLPSTLVIVYAWNPLPVKEFANSGHLDSVSIFAATWSLYALICGRPLRAGAFWGLSMLGKTWSAVLWPLYLQRGRLRGVVACALVVAAGVLPFAGAGRDLLAGSAAYARGWEFNSGLFAVLQAGASYVGLEGRTAAKLVGAAVWLVVAGIVVAARSKEPLSALRQSALLIGVALVVSPVCNPWYVCWLLPLLCIHRSPAWLAFTGLVMLSYAYYAEPLGVFDPAARAAEYAALAGLLVWEQVGRHPHRLWEGLCPAPGGPGGVIPQAGQRPWP